MSVRSTPPETVVIKSALARIRHVQQAVVVTMAACAFHDDGDAPDADEVLAAIREALSPAYNHLYFLAKNLAAELHALAAPDDDQQAAIARGATVSIAAMTIEDES